MVSGVACVVCCVVHGFFFVCCVLHVLFGVVYEVTLVKNFELSIIVSLELACLTVGLMGLKHIHLVVVFYQVITG